MGQKRKTGEDLFGPAESAPCRAGDPMVEQSEERPNGNKDCVSAWIKSLRLGRLQDSMYWLNVMANDQNTYYIAMRMATFAGEDCWDMQSVVLTDALIGLVEKKVPDIWNHLYYVNWYLCRCKKVWEDEGGVEVMRELLNIEKRCVMNDNKKVIAEPIPLWATDLHTSLGREAAREGRWAMVDRRFGGELVGILTRVLMFKKHGRIDPELGYDEFWEAQGIVKKMKGEKQPAGE